MNSMPFRQLKSFFKILIGVQYENLVGAAIGRPLFSPFPGTCDRTQKGSLV